MPERKSHEQLDEETRRLNLLAESQKEEMRSLEERFERERQEAYGEMRGAVEEKIRERDAYKKLLIRAIGLCTKYSHLVADHQVTYIADMSEAIGDMRKLAERTRRR